MKEVKAEEAIILNPGVCIWCGGGVPPFNCGSLVAHHTLENNFFELCEECDPDLSEEGYNE